MLVLLEKLSMKEYLLKQRSLSVAGWGLIVICAFMHFSLSAQSSPKRPASPVQVDTVSEMVLPAAVDLMGTLHSRTYIPITAGVNGRLSWLVEPGTFVKQGEPLVKMDTLPLELRLAEQKAQIKRAKINQRYLKNEVVRLAKLRETNAASQFQLDQTQSQYELASADLDIAQLKLRQVEDQLQRANIVAPFDGVVTERLVRAGTDVSRSNILLRFLDSENLEARVYVPVKYLAYLRKGKLLQVSTNEQSMSAEVIAIIPSADVKSQTVEVRIIIPQELNELWAAGQLVKVSVPVQAATPSLTVHRDALILRKDGTYIVKVGNDNKVHRVPVIVGTGTTERVSITGDIRDGDKVATRGAERLQDNQEVVVQ